MTKNEYLESRMAELTGKADELQAKIQASEDVEEARSLTAELEALTKDIEAMKSLENEEERTASADEKVPENAILVNGGKVKMAEERKNDYASLEYRQAFMAYAQKGTPIPAEFRAANETADTGAAIPVTVMNEVINTVRKRYGNLYGKCRKIAIQGGVKFPIGSLQATAKWINESTVSPRQEIGSTRAVVFLYNELELRVATSFLASIVTLDAFEQKVVEILAIAFLQAMDNAIVNGDGNGKPEGILHCAEITNIVTMTAAQMGDWTAWRKRFFASLPLGYRDGEFIFPLSTVESYLETMADSNNNPIFRQATGLEVNDGDARDPNGRFFGRNISIVEPDILPDFDTASANDVIGIYWQPQEYAINENFAWTMFRYLDHETNEWVDKGIAIVDGKVLNPAGFVLIKKA